MKQYSGLRIFRTIKEIQMRIIDNFPTQLIQAAAADPVCEN